MSNQSGATRDDKRQAQTARYEKPTLKRGPVLGQFAAAKGSVAKKKA